MDELEFQGTPGSQSVSKHLIRQAWPVDLPWLLELVHLAYPMALNRDRVQESLIWAMHHSNFLVLRGKRSAGVAYWEPSPIDETLKSATCAALWSVPGRRDWEPYHLLGGLVEWASKEGCRVFRGDSETDHDIAPFLRRLGGIMENPTYRIDLGKRH